MRAAHDDRVASPATGAVSPRERLAAALSELLGLPVGIALFVSVGAASLRSHVTGAGWGLLGITIAAVLPYVLTRRLRRDRPVSGPAARAARVRYLSTAAGTAAVGLALLVLLPAPRQVVAITAAFLAGAAVAALLSTRWRVSNHTTAVAGAAAMWTVLYGPWLLLTYVLALVLAWARVTLDRHTLTETLIGIVVGSAVSAAVVMLVA